MTVLDDIFQEVITNPWTEEEYQNYIRKEKIDRILEPIALGLYLIAGMSPSIALIGFVWWVW